MYKEVGSNQKKENMLSEESENRMTIQDKLIQFFFTKADRETGGRRIRNSEFAKNIVTNHFQKKFEGQKKKAYIFNLDTVIEYPKKFAEKFRNENKPFVININKSPVVDLQIIHPCLIEIPKRDDTGKFGFTIHLPFDPTYNDAREELELIKEREYFNDFKHNSNEGIEDYILDCSEDYNLLDKMMQRILVDLKDYKKEDEILISHFFL